MVKKWNSRVCGKLTFSPKSKWKYSSQCQQLLSLSKTGVNILQQSACLYHEKSFHLVPVHRNKFCPKTYLHDMYPAWTEWMLLFLPCESVYVCLIMSKCSPEDTYCSREPPEKWFWQVFICLWTDFVNTNCDSRPCKMRSWNCTGVLKRVWSNQ